MSFTISNLGQNKPHSGSDFFANDFHLFLSLLDMDGTYLAGTKPLADSYWQVQRTTSRVQ